MGGGSHAAPFASRATLTEKQAAEEPHDEEDLIRFREHGGSMKGGHVAHSSPLAKFPQSSLHQVPPHQEPEVKGADPSGNRFRVEVSDVSRRSW